MKDPMKLVPGKLYVITQNTYRAIFDFKKDDIVMCVGYEEKHPTHDRGGTRGYMKLLQGKKLLEGAVNNTAIEEYFKELL